MLDTHGVSVEQQARPLPLYVGDQVIDPPVVLAPMAGITNRAFRRLCRESGAGLYVSEMVTSRALVERNEATLDMVTFADDESPRSVQLYGVDPQVMAEAVRIIVDEDRADHIDMNFGCPVPKVTRKGGGSALMATHIDLGLAEARVLDLTPFKAKPRARQMDEAFL